MCCRNNDGYLNTVNHNKMNINKIQEIIEEIFSVFYAISIVVASTPDITFQSPDDGILIPKGYSVDFLA